MAIDTSGEYWVGSESADIDEYLRSFTSDGYPADKFVHARCTCGAGQFALLAGADVAQRTCIACAAAHFICDSGEFWDEAEPEAVGCPCDGTTYEVAVGFSHRDDGSIKWITVGVRCVRCGILGAAADWKIDYEPSAHLYDQV